jgi:guanylate kinase
MEVTALNLAYALIGPPSCGKSAIAKELTKYGVAEFVSYTTRPPRPGEQDGIDYRFIDKETFANTELIEKITYSGHFYGLGKKEVMGKIEKNPVSVVGVDRNGFYQLRKLLGQRVISIFILVDEHTIIDRVIEQCGNPEAVQERINYAKAAGEFDDWQIADYVVKNTASLEDAVRQVLAIMKLVDIKPVSVAP